MPLFTKNWLSGLGRDASNAFENIMLQWFKDNWTLTDPALWHQQDNPFGVIFGTEYLGYFDYVAYTTLEDGARTELMSIGGRHENHIKDITFSFCVRNYSGVRGEEIPVQVNNVFEFVEDLIDSNPRGLASEGIRYMFLRAARNGEMEVYGQQIYHMDFVIRCIIPKINLE
jgi:hypothetical protein